MASIPNGVYAIAKLLPPQSVTSLGGDEGAPVVLLPPPGAPGEQDWIIETVPSGNITIKNVNSGLYLSYDGEPSVNLRVASFPEPREWRLLASPEPFFFFVVVPGGPVDGTELAFDSSLLRIFPPNTALRPLDVDNQEQAWNFQFHE